jgi:dolichyl-phosphate beta-glucosyltransferase
VHMSEMADLTIKLSVVIPAYNEEARLGKTLEAVEAWAAARNNLLEVVVVDDGSQDGTLRVAESWAASVPLRANSVLPIVVSAPHRGKGAAVAKGILSAQGAVRVFMDADLAIPMAYVDRVVEEIRRGADVVIGSREMEGSQRRGEPWLRHLMGRLFNRLVAVIAIRGILDTQCGLKGFSADAAEDIFNRVLLYPPDADVIENSRVTAFDIEVLAIARIRDRSIVEIPVEWRHVAVSKVRPLPDAVLMLGEALLVRWNLWRRRYE